MKKSVFIFILICFCLHQNVNAQSNYLKFKPYKPYTWMVGAGWSFVDNDGRPYTKIFDVINGWSIMPYPSHAFVDRYLKHGMSLELGLTFNQYTGKLVNAIPNASGMMFNSDLTFKYSFYNLWHNKLNWFDPYIGIGIGASYITVSSPAFYPTANAVVGGNFWFGDWGIRIQGAAKFGFIPTFYRTNTNYLNYTAAVVYRFHERDKKNRSNDKPRYKWVRDKPGRYKGKKTE